MRVASLVRFATGNEGTFGTMTLDSGFYCFTLELPWSANQRGKSCIPEGKYDVVWAESPGRKEHTYRLMNVPGRDGILIHSANLAGDKDQGFVSQLEGCIAPGLAVVKFRAGLKPAGARNQRGVAASRTALAKLLAELGTKPWTLAIKWAEGIKPDGKLNDPSS